MIKRKILEVDGIVIFQKNTRYQPDRCKHKVIIFDEQLAYLECEDCGEKLNPIAWIAALADDINSLGAKYTRRLAKAQVIEEKLNKTNRWCCDHCGEVSSIKPEKLFSAKAIDTKMKLIEQGGDL